MKTTVQQRDAILNLFSFVEEVSGFRQTIIKDFSSCDWKLLLRDIDLTLPGIQDHWNRENTNNVLLSIERLNFPPCPPLPAQLTDFVIGDWRSPSWSGRWKKTIRSDSNATAIDTVRSEWLTLRGQWISKREQISRSNALFDRFEQLRNKIAESNLRYEAILGNFIFSSDIRLSSVKNEVHYPLIVRTLDVSLSSSENNLPLITVRLCAEEPTRLLNSVLQCFAEDKVNFSALDPIEQYLLKHNPLPILCDELTEKMTDFTVQFSTACRWHEVDAPLEEVDSGVSFRIEDNPIILLQEKFSGLTRAITCIRNQILETGEVPQHLLEIVCPGFAASVNNTECPASSLEESLAATAGEDPGILLTKPANSEQLSIAHEVMRNNVVLVQGPPGTGKTHTIANLIGHFLANGQRVLVTSYTQKALSVLKSQLPVEIQPLTVSMLEDRRDLELTAAQLKDRLDALSLPALRHDIEQLEEERSKITDRLKTLRRTIYESRLKDTGGIQFADKSYCLTELARELRESERFSKQIPGEVVEGAFPLTDEELESLYKSNTAWSKTDLRDLNSPIPALKDLPDPEKMWSMYQEYTRLQQYRTQELGIIKDITAHSNSQGQSFSDYVFHDGIVVSIQTTQKQALLTLAENPTLQEVRNDPFIRHCVTACCEDSSYAEIYQDLAVRLQETAKAYCALDQFLIETPTTFEIKSTEYDSIFKAVQWFIANQPEGQPGFFKKAFDNAYKQAKTQLQTVLVNGHTPGTRQDYAALEIKLKLLTTEQSAARLWNELAARSEAPAYETFGEKAGIYLSSHYTALIDKAVSWAKDEIPNLLNALTDAGFNVKGIPVCTAAPGTAEYLQYFQALDTTILSPLKSVFHWENDMASIEQWKSSVCAQLTQWAAISTTGRNLMECVLTEPAQWQEQYAHLVELHRQKVSYDKRQKILKKLGDSAPGWRDAILNGQAGFADRSLAPTNIHAAWDWKQKEILFNQHIAQTPKNLQKETLRLAEVLRRNTIKLVAAKAWYAVKVRLEGSESLSNLAMLATYMNRSYGTGKRTAVYREEADNLLPQCQDAVPAWIMMTGDALRNFNSNARFDVVIIDEASQADLTTLPILYMGDKIIVVGDDQQVTPLAIGTSDTAVENLGRRYLEGHVKAAKLYDARISLYSIIQNLAFPTHVLREHFRCVPEIIGYCNRLSYNGTILPLRDRSSSHLTPSIVPYRVDGTCTDTGVNEVECQAVIRLLKAMWSDEAYRNKTFGIISMRSGQLSQINRLKALIMSQFDPRLVQERQLLCGSSAEFQGDERDIIILTMVDSAEPGSVLRKTGDGAEDSMKKRYNVAVSRARDQLWVIHSFDPITQLKPDDIRTGLFAWINLNDDPSVEEPQFLAPADTTLIAGIAKGLMDRGYSVYKHYDAGSYRIDMVVRCGEHAIAIECDDDQISTDESIRHDMEKQTILERSGWQFIRVRGAEYFREPRATVERLSLTLRQNGILPSRRDQKEPEPKNEVLTRILNLAERFSRGDSVVPQYITGASQPSQEIDTLAMSELTMVTDITEEPDPSFVRNYLKAKIGYANPDCTVEGTDEDFAILDSDKKTFTRVKLISDYWQIHVRALPGQNLQNMPKPAQMISGQWNVWKIPLEEMQHDDSEYLMRIATFIQRSALTLQPEN